MRERSPQPEHPGWTGPPGHSAEKPLPYTGELKEPQPNDDPAAVIPVEQVREPIFLDCAGMDEV